MDDSSLEKVFDDLLAYGDRRRWAGYDPYDALRSPALRMLSFGARWPRIAWIQLLKRSPVNLRPAVGVPRGTNPKGLALVARALVHEGAARGIDRRARVAELLERLDALRCLGTTGSGWGYNFDWQSRAFFVPRGTPSIVCTTFVANAYLDAYLAWGEREWLARARDACDFVVKDLNRTEGEGGSFCFSYTPLDRTSVHNASMLGAELLARVGRETGEEALLDIARRATEFTVAGQAGDGSWPYGALGFQSWIDNFHTGFVLVSLDAVRRALDEPAWDAPVERGYRFFQESFFLADGTPKYYHDEVYPIDIHSAAQALVTFAAFAKVDRDALAMGRKVARWAIVNMLGGDGAFYFQKHRRYTNRTSYIRWSQAWMVYGLARLMAAEREAAGNG
ncbi:MAG TPA: delta-aminolevulinic acid dehydratase [Blastocatellia bacterium]|nr:delta-aminolevulinic acid dehydratase [Blastocatellia bacterium]